ncbi:hypothetical protein LCI18_011233 [Fusarium solani-melongenae]|uniref:Uncharacterized protein n=1 Tax=Fusarium solani subsp. cucurbitae TaxID=2747967 RepID=A0ACD3ZG57_FUSSC|nr:hypothetical protein LCI18_011233 [Fusarium solani-melongenae]
MGAKQDEMEGAMPPLWILQTVVLFQVFYRVRVPSPSSSTVHVMRFKTDYKTLQCLVAKGRSLHEELTQAVIQRGHEYVPLKEIAPGYQTRLNSGRMPSLEEQDSMATFLDDEGCPIGGHVFVEVINPGSQVAPPYQNFVHASGTDILCMYNYSSKDQLRDMPHQIY